VLRNILENREFSAHVATQTANRMITERQWSVVDAAPSGQGVRSGALLFLHQK
jgi:hypothetical protein